MKVLHVASFSGNIGDNASHLGLRSVLAGWIQEPIEYVEREIRYCYQNYRGSHRWSFDEKFVAQANLSDLVVIGGGNFFEPWLEKSSTGTTVDLAPKLLEAITTPVVFYGVGFDPHKGFNEDTLERFSSFVSQALAQPNVYLSFRNDGSHENFSSLFSVKVANAIPVVPDGAFFYQCSFPPISLPCGRYWGINLAADMKERRFTGEGSEALSWEDFIGHMAWLLENALEADDYLKIVLFPHIASDLDAISDLMSSLDDRFCRGRVLVAPLFHSWYGCDVSFSMYKQCELILGMRFHANVCPIALGVPTIGLATYPKLNDLHREIGLSDRLVDVRYAGFSNKLVEKIRQSIDKRDQLKSENLALIKDLRLRLNGLHDFLSQVLSTTNR